MHIIQKRIIKHLALARHAKYSDMKPTNIEGNQFSYHLKSLLTQKLVQKKETNYSLSNKGLQYCTQVSFEHLSIRIQPKIVTLIACKNKNGEYLVYKRSKQPLIDMVGLPYGKVHMGEKITDAAKRELKEKTGLTATLTQKGIVYITIKSTDGEIILQMLCHIFSGKNPKGIMRDNFNKGDVFWQSKKDLLSSDTMPGVAELLKIADTKKKCLIFDEFEFIIK